MSHTPTTSDAGVHKAAMALPSVFMTEQWMGSHVYKVGDTDTFKMFAILNPGKAQLTLKAPNPEVAAMLIAAEVAQRHTHLPRGNWVMLKLDRLEPDDVAERLQTSHRVVTATLTKAARKKFALD